MATRAKKAAPEKPQSLEQRVSKRAADERNFVKKAVNWALRSVGKRNAALNAAAVAVARRLADSQDAARRWAGKGALKELTGASVVRRLAARSG
jgi:3-methyladenine DNA glycosylase AlkD